MAGLNVNQGGTPTEATPYYNDGGVATQPNAVYVNEGGSPVKVWPNLAVEDFETGDLSRWNTTSSVADWSVTTAAAEEQTTYGLDIGGGGYIYDTSGGVPNYPSAGDEFEVLMRPGWSQVPPIIRFYFAMQNENTDNIYRVELQENFIGFEKRVNGSTTGIMSGGTSLTQGNLTRLYVDWPTNGEFTITLEDVDAGTTEFTETLGSADAETDFTSGGVGIWSNAYVRFSVDEWVIL